MRHTQWTLCRISRQKLRAPIMIDRLGQLYNKEALIEYLLRKSTKTVSEAETKVAGHIRGLKDVRQVQLHVNPTHEAAGGDALYYPYACPLTQRVMNGKHKFVCLWPCGCVMSETGLRETAFPGQKKRPEDKATTPCPQCGVLFGHDALWKDEPSVDADLIWLYPPTATQAMLREQLVAHAAASRKKRKAKQVDNDTTKRVRAAVDVDTTPSLNQTAPGAYAVQQVRAAQAQAAQHEAAS
ncbi:Replication termination factor 2 [Malassezia pachydermatis]